MNEHKSITFQLQAIIEDMQRRKAAQRARDLRRAGELDDTIPDEPLPTS